MQNRKTFNYTVRHPDWLSEDFVINDEISVETLELLKMNRLCNVCIAIMAMIPLFFPILVIGIFVRRASPGPALYRSDRVGRNNKIFKMPKFRTLCVGTPPVATHLLTYAATFLTPMGSFLRTASLDELPQLRSVPKGDMNFAAPSRAIFNQNDLNALRSAHGVRQLVPGLIGWAQANGRDELPISDKVKLDAEYLRRRSFWYDLRVLWLTFAKVLHRDGVSH